MTTNINKTIRYEVMSLLRNESGVETIERACPICHSDVKGNDIYLYFCVKCNILYRKEDLMLTKETVNDLLKQKVAEKFSKDKSILKIEDKKIKEKDMTEKKIIILKDLREAKKYYISRKSDVIHVSNCPYGKNIKKENRITLRSLEGTGKYRRCKCMTE